MKILWIRNCNYQINCFIKILILSFTLNIEVGEGFTDKKCNISYTTQVWLIWLITLTFSHLSLPSASGMTNLTNYSTLFPFIITICFIFLLYAGGSQIVKINCLWKCVIYQICSFGWLILNKIDFVNKKQKSKFI